MQHSDRKESFNELHSVDVGHLNGASFATHPWNKNIHTHPATHALISQSIHTQPSIQLTSHPSIHFTMGSYREGTYKFRT